MARTYAGILGLLAFLTALAHGLMHGGGGVSVLWTAWCSLLLFALLGCVIGWVAERIVEDSVHGQVAAELTARQSAKAPHLAADGE